MGNQSSTQSLASTQAISNQINNVSNENCITACDSDVSNINMLIENSDIEGNINISAVCSVIGSSCILKAALSNSVQNTQKNSQSAEAMQESDPLSWFSSSTSDQQEDSNQSTANRVSNIINSTCQNNSTSNVDGINIELIGDKVGGNVNVNSAGSVSKSQCILDNASRTTLANDQSNSQTAKVMQGSALLFGIIAVVIVIVVIMIGLVILGMGGIGGIFALKGLSEKGNPQGNTMRPGMPPGMRPGMPPGMRPTTYRVR